MKRSVVMGYARSSNDYDGLIGRYMKSTTDEERLRYLEGLASFKNPELVAKTLDFALSGKVKRQDVRNVILYATANPDAKIDRKSTRLNSSHLVISYAVFCLK